MLNKIKAQFKVREHFMVLPSLVFTCEMLADMLMNGGDSWVGSAFIYLIAHA